MKDPVAKERKVTRGNSGIGLLKEAKNGSLHNARNEPYAKIKGNKPKTFQLIVTPIGFLCDVRLHNTKLNIMDSILLH